MAAASAESVDGAAAGAVAGGAAQAEADVAGLALLDSPSCLSVSCRVTVRTLAVHFNFISRMYSNLVLSLSAGVTFDCTLLPQRPFAPTAFTRVLFSIHVCVCVCACALMCACARACACVCVYVQECVCLCVISC